MHKCTNGVRCMWHLTAAMPNAQSERQSQCQPNAQMLQLTNKSAHCESKIAQMHKLPISILMEKKNSNACQGIRLAKHKWLPSGCPQRR